MNPIVIVGGGIGGLASALALAHLGYQSIVLESRPPSAHIDRGDVLHAGVLPLLSRWGADRDIAAHNPFQFHRFRIASGNGRILLDADTREILGDNHCFTSLRHPNITAALRSAAHRTGLVDVVNGVRCVELLGSGGRISEVHTATATYPSSLAIIASGARSRLARRYFGAPNVYRYATAFYNACVRTVDGYGDCGFYILSDDGAMVLVPLPEGLQRIGIQVRSSQLNQVAAPDFLRETIAARFRPLAGVPLELVERPHTYRLYRAVNDWWSRPGAILLGDAARQVHPVGGQGMNLAIRDADVLAGCLNAAGCPRAATRIDHAIASYGAQRQRSVRPTLRRTHLLGVAAERAPTAASMAAVQLAGRIMPVKRNLLRAMMDVR